jgi:hypothetical protein
MGYSVVNSAEVEGAGPGGAVKFLRRELGVELPPNGRRRGSYEARGPF